MKVKLLDRSRDRLQDERENVLWKENGNKDDLKREQQQIGQSSRSASSANCAERLMDRPGNRLLPGGLLW